MNAWTYAWLFKASLFIVVAVCALVVVPHFLLAGKMSQYKDTISDSKPSSPSNHTLSFTLLTDVSPGGYIEFIPPVGFQTVSSANFTERNVELIVNGTSRSVGVAQTGTDDMVEIFPGSPGLVRYTLNTSTGITSGSEVEFKVGNHTSNAVPFVFTFSPGVGTSSAPLDVKPIINATDAGTHTVDLIIYDGVEVASAGFLIAVVEGVGVGPADTTEIIPPVRFNGAPTIFVGGTTQSIELSLETDEFAVCRYASAAGVAYSAMSNTFTNTGTIFHTRILPVSPETTYSYYVRCIDDEGNFNLDD
jgi:hypothetical protein